MDWHELRRLALYHGMKPNEYWASSFADVVEFVYARSEAESEHRKVIYDAMRINTSWVVSFLTTGSAKIKPTDILKFKDEEDQEVNEMESILNDYKNIDFTGADKIAREMGFIN